MTAGDYLDLVSEACSALDEEDVARARRVIRERPAYHARSSRKGRGYSYSVRAKTRIFLKDGFVDRYSGERMVFPPVLRILSFLMPDAFPFHAHWKMDECHIAYWHLLPTIDHIVPVSRGGRDDEENLVCTSQLRNSAKGTWLLEELGWELHPPGSLDDWDGMLSWFVGYVDRHPNVLEDGCIRQWHATARRLDIGLTPSSTKACRSPT